MSGKCGVRVTRSERAFPWAGGGALKAHVWGCAPQTLTLPEFRRAEEKGHNETCAEWGLGRAQGRAQSAEVEGRPSIRASARTRDPLDHIAASHTLSGQFLSSVLRASVEVSRLQKI